MNIIIHAVRCFKFLYLDALCAFHAWRLQRRTGLNARAADRAGRRAYSRAKLIDSTDEASALSAARRAFCAELNRSAGVT
jgi:hypothetical protein